MPVANKRWKPPTRGTDAVCDAIRDLDAQIAHTEAGVETLRYNRRELRRKLRIDRGWTWAQIALVSKQTIGAIQKDLARTVRPKAVRARKAS